MTEKRRMKNEKRKTENGRGKNGFALLFFSFLLSLFILTGCTDLMKPPKQAGNGFGTVFVQFGNAGGGERTAFPSTDFASYEYAFARTDAQGAATGQYETVAPNTDGSFTLEAGNWKVRVKAFADVAGTPTLAAEGESDMFTLAAEGSETVRVALTAAADAGTGAFRYTFRYPTNVTLDNARVTVTRLPGMAEVVNRSFSPAATGQFGATADLEGGYYLISVRLTVFDGYDDNWNALNRYAGISEAVHIYPLTDTVYEYAFAAEDFSANRTPVADDYELHGELNPFQGSVTAVTVTPKPGASPGAITRIMYNYSDNVPQNPGEYVIRINVAAAPGWNAANNLEVGTLTVAAGTEITNVAVLVTAPERDMTPDTTATGNNDPLNYTVESVAWTPNHDTFQSGVRYTARVTILADSGYIFPFNSFSFTVNEGANTFFQRDSTNIRRGTLTYTFVATTTKTLTDMTVISQPAKLEYAHNTNLDLTGLAIRMDYDDGTTEDVLGEHLTGQIYTNIAASPSHLTRVSRPAHNGTRVTIRSGEFSVTTDPLTVNPSLIEFDVVIALSLSIEVDYTGSPHEPFYLPGVNQPGFTVTYGGTDLVRNSDFTAAFTDNINPGTASVVFSGINNYEGSTGSGTFTIRKAAVTTVAAPTAASFTPTSVTLNAAAALPNQTIQYARNTTNAAPESGWQAELTFTGLTRHTPYYFFARSAENEFYSGNVASAGTAITPTGLPGAAVPAPTAAEGQATSITLTAITASNGQTVEYARNTTNAVPSSGWQTTLVFSGLTQNTVYHFFARSVQNAVFETGTASHTAIRTPVPGANISLAVQQVIDGAPIVAAITLSRTGSGGIPITSTVTLDNPSQYTSVSWEIAGVGATTAPVTGSGNSFTLDAANVSYNALGTHALILTVVKDGRRYQRAIPFTVVQ